jgi:hypothetical protein
MRAKAILLVGLAVLIAAPATQASALVLNLSGQFQCVQGCAPGFGGAVAYTQTNWLLNLVNEAGIPSRARIDWPGHLWAENWNEGAIYSADGLTIQFDRGTVWQRVVAVPVVPPPYPPLYYPPPR